jgi:DNA-binding transcriptional regulator YhcF (GntR family)
MIQETPSIRIDLTSPVPAYQQIVAALRALLVAGELKPGYRLPTVRQLATDLGVHHNTVAEAYRALAAEGWLDLRRRLGATVLARPAPRPGPQAKADFARSLRELVAKTLAEGVPAASVVGEMAKLGESLSRADSEQVGGRP